jgi:hypothetical protein
MTEQAEKMLALIPENGNIGNVSLRKALGETPEAYFSVRQELLTAGLIATGRGKGGSVHRTKPEAEAVRDMIVAATL